MEDSRTVNVSDEPNDKESELKKERPKSLHLESSNFDTDQQRTPEDDAGSGETTRKAKEFSSSQEDLQSRNNGESRESPEDVDDNGQRPSSRGQTIANSLKSKIRDLSPSRKLASNVSPVSKTAERKTSKAKSKQPKSPANWLPASFNQIFSNYKTKCGDFRRLFKDLPDTEQLIVDYSCALQRDILVHGRLYVSQNWLCFYANIFGWETFVTIKCTDVNGIRKEKTALVIPNAVQVCTETEKYFFASFISRDTTYTVLFRIWQNALLDQPLSPSELIQVVGKYSESHDVSSDNDDDSDDSDDGKEVQLSNDSCGSEADVEGEMPSGDSLSSLSHSSFGTEFAVADNQSEFRKAESDSTPKVSITPPSPAAITSKPTDTLNRNTADQQLPLQSEGELNTTQNGEKRPHSRPTSPHLHLKNLLRSPAAKKRMVTAEATRQQQQQSTADPDNKRAARVSSDLEEEGTASDDHDAENNDYAPVTCVCDDHLSKEYVNQEFPVSVDTLYEYLFTESDFYKRVQKARKTKDLVFNPWMTTEDGQKRTIRYTVSLNHAIGPKHSATTEKQHCLQGSVPGKIYMVHAEVNNEGIPYGDSFSITSRYCITRASVTTSRLRVTAEVKYHKSVWGFVRNMIEKNAVEGIADYFQFLAESLRRETTEGQWIKKRKTSPTRRHKRNRSLKNNEAMEPTNEASIDVKTSLLQRLSLKGVISSVMGMRSHVPQVRAKNPLALCITVLLGVLLVVNVFLVHRLLLLEQATYTGIHWDGTIKDLPADASQWSSLLQEQKKMQEMEMRRWRDVLTSSIQLMNQVQRSLDLLQIELSKEHSSDET